MKTGTVKFFNQSKGYGFIVDETDNREIFVHVSGLSEPVQQEDKVSFEEMEGKKGLNAVNVKKIS